MDVFGENIYSNTFGSCIFYKQNIYYNTTMQFHFFELQIFFLIYNSLHNECLKHSHKKVCCVYKNKCFIVTSVLLLLLDFPVSATYLLCCLNRVWIFPTERLGDAITCYIYNGNRTHALSWSKRFFFVGFGVIMFKDKPYWDPLLGLLRGP